MKAISEGSRSQSISPGQLEVGESIGQLSVNEVIHVDVEVDLEVSATMDLGKLLDADLQGYNFLVRESISGKEWDFLTRALRLGGKQTPTSLTRDDEVATRWGRPEEVQDGSTMAKLGRGAREGSCSRGDRLQRWSSEWRQTTMKMVVTVSVCMGLWFRVSLDAYDPRRESAGSGCGCGWRRRVPGGTVVLGSMRRRWWFRGVMIGKIKTAEVT
ncbi:hypothetical protein L1987_54794 [Smallanthus sonchifolius]|uniref:Uncharacterized protein n=1 Tax=Smallanthus sonchifolius TaxID=185202 RepID=A0ACB9E879_9ASTR|nr:hypothetical protein L1987_54794 [Smallanthus sonchifolius]